MTKTELYATAYSAVEGAMRAVGFPVSMSTGLDIEHIAHRVADAIYVVMQIEERKARLVDNVNLQIK